MATARHTLAFVGAFAGAAFLSGAARADPQASAGFTIGVAGVGLDRKMWEKTLLHAGLRGDVLFGRSGNDDFGVGPYAEVLTLGLKDIQFGAGVSALAPVSELFPVVVSAGMYGRRSVDAYGLQPGFAAALFWGLRSYNFHSSYVISSGLLAELRLGLGETRETAIVLGAQLDLALLGAPLVLLVNAIKGPSRAAEPLR